MTPDQKRHIATAMVNRSRQWKTRVGIAGVVTLAFFGYVGPVFAGAWFVAYALLQLLERRVDFKMEVFHLYYHVVLKLQYRHNHTSIKRLKY